MATQSAYDQNMANRKLIEDNLKKPGAVTINGLPTVNEPPPKLTTPTFDANTYYNNQAGQLTDLSSKQKELTLAQYRQARDKSIGGINDLKKDVTPAYQQSRDQADFQSRQAAQRLREMMASRGTYDGGENVTAQVANNATLQRGLNDLNLQERKTIDTYDKQIADLLDPSQEQNIISQSDIELLRQLADLRGRADDRQYDNDWRVYGANYQSGQDDIHNKLAQDTFDFDKQKFNVSNGWEARKWQHGLDREKVDDGRYIDERDYARKMDAIKLARSGGSGGGGRRSGGGSRGGGSKSKTSAYDIKKNYISNTVESRKAPIDAMAQLQRDKGNLKKAGLEDWEIAEIEKYIIDWGNNESDRTGARFVPAPLSDYDKWNLRR